MDSTTQYIPFTTAGKVTHKRSLIVPVDNAANPISMKRDFLLIDDDADEIVLLREALYETVIGCCCEWVQSVEVALAMLERHIPDLILIDYNMPRINGIDGVKMIRAIPGLKNVPIIFYSTSIDAETKKRALEAGADLAVQKQHSTEALIKLLSDFLFTRFSPRSTTDRTK